MKLVQVKNGPNKGKGQIWNGDRLVAEYETYYSALVAFKERGCDPIRNQ
jgi:hypothetical protein